MVEIITSLQNPKIKNILKLQKRSSERKKQNLIVIEGIREISLAQKAGINIKSVFVCPEIMDSGADMSALEIKNQYFELSAGVYSKLAYRGSTEGVVVLAEPKYYGLNDLSLRKNPLITVLESVEKPGNLGAILRTADAASVDAVIISDPLTDIYNPNTIRSSLGCVFTNKVIACSSDSIIQWLRINEIRSFAAALTASKPYHQMDYTGAVAIILGTEAEGLTDKWLKNADEQIKIPMSGEVDSLNVSASAAILLFEVMRQRNFYK